MARLEYPGGFDTKRTDAPASSRWVAEAWRSQFVVAFGHVRWQPYAVQALRRTLQKRFELLADRAYETTARSIAPHSGQTR